MNALKKVLLTPIVKNNPKTPVGSLLHSSKWIPALAGLITAILIIAIIEADKYARFGFW